MKQILKNLNNTFSTVHNELTKLLCNFYKMNKIRNKGIRVTELILITVCNIL